MPQKPLEERNQANSLLTPQRRSQRRFIGLAATAKQLKDRLATMGHHIGRLVELYRDVVPGPARKAAVEIELATTERSNQLEQQGFAREYLRWLDKEIRELIGS
jgi:hypothetical protein